jgi:hypothetical protein
MAPAIFLRGWIFATLWHKKVPMLLRQKKGSFVFFFSPFVLNVFPLCSNEVPEVPKTFPIAPLIYPIWFAQKFNSHACKLKSWAIGEGHLFLFCNWGLKRCFYWGNCPMCPKKTWWWANQYGSLETRKKVVSALMNYTPCVLSWASQAHIFKTTTMQMQCGNEPHGRQCGKGKKNPFNECNSYTNWVHTMVSKNTKCKKLDERVSFLSFMDLSCCYKQLIQLLFYSSQLSNITQLCICLFWMAICSTCVV